jgi:hypothetical protein
MTFPGPPESMPRCRSITLSRSSIESSRTWTGSDVAVRRAHPDRARNAAVLTRFWHEVEQYRRVPLREVST